MTVGDPWVDRHDSAHRIFDWLRMSCSEQRSATPTVLEPMHFGNALNMGLIETCEADDCDELDRYIEAHLHGPVSLAEDVEALVLDECYRETQVSVDAMKLPVAIEWHSGFRVSLDTIRQFPDYRGEPIVTLVGILAVDGHITPAVIGAAAVSGKYSFDDLKKVWHYVARFATPRWSTVRNRTLSACWCSTNPKRQ